MPPSSSHPPRHVPPGQTYLPYYARTVNHVFFSLQLYASTVQTVVFRALFMLLSITLVFIMYRRDRDTMTIQYFHVILNPIVTAMAVIDGTESVRSVLEPFGT